MITVSKKSKAKNYLNKIKEKHKNNHLNDSDNMQEYLTTANLGRKQKQDQGCLTMNTFSKLSTKQTGHVSFAMISIDFEEHYLQCTELNAFNVIPTKSEI